MCCCGSGLSEFFRGRGLLHLKDGSMKGKMSGRLCRRKGADRLGREIRGDRSAIGRWWQEHRRVGPPRGCEQRVDRGGCGAGRGMEFIERVLL